MIASDLGRFGRIASAALLVYALAVAAVQLAYVLDTSYINEQFRLLFSYHRLDDPSLFTDDYLAGYVGAAAKPLLYEWLTRSWILAGGELFVLHRVMPLACWLAFLGGVLLAARDLGDRLTMLAALALVVAQPLYLYQITSAVPHAFAFPLLAWALVAQLRGSVPGLVAATLMAGLLYPVMAPLPGMLLAWQLLFVQRWLHQPRARQARALGLLAATGAAALWLLLQAISRTTEFGAAVEPMQQLDLYPENGPDGQYFYGMFHPLKYVFARAISQLRLEAGPFALLVVVVYLAIGFYGLVTLPRGNARTAVFVFIVAAAVLWLLVHIVKPAQTYRFIFYPALTLLPLLFVGGVQRFCARLSERRRQPAALAVAVLAAFVLAFDSTDSQKAGYWWQLDGEFHEVADFAAGQPPESLFAVWPGGRGDLELLPYLARRPVFVMAKLHYPNYEKHILEMRARSYAVIEAYLATGQAPLRELHCRWGVDFLVVEKAHFQAGGERPSYFAPFDQRIEEVWQAHRPRDFLLSAPPAAAIALETANYRLVGLKALAGACDRSGT